MAKPVKVFYGTDTYGVRVERALSDAGKWFSRCYGFNGFSQCWSKWEESETPTFESTGVNQYTGEEFEYDSPVCMWGWNKLDECTAPLPRYRLPV